MSLRTGFLTTLCATVLSPGPLAASAAAQDPVVRAVLFYSPTCPHCHAVIRDDLPVLFERYGGNPQVWADTSVPSEVRPFFLASNGTLEILLVNASLEEGYRVFDASTASHRVPRESAGVPRLVVADTFLVGSHDIPTLLPGFVEEALEGGGLDWPEIPGLDAALASLPRPEPQLPQTETAPDTATRASGIESVAQAPTDLWGRLSRDPIGNWLAILVLAGMIASVVGVLGTRGMPVGLGRAIPLLSLLGIGVAAYLTYVEVSGATAVCGPVGDCNTVQQSDYAAVFGVPVGLLGLLGYVAIMLAWLVARISAAAADWAKLGLLAMTLVGTLFSIYLTFLEPFVIGASCAWCLTSAIVMTALMWLSAGAGWEAWERIRVRSS